MADSDAGFLDALINKLRSATGSPKPPPTNVELVHPNIIGASGGAQRAAQDLKTRKAKLDQAMLDSGA